MAALPETPFALLLRADSEQTLPDSDADVIAALTTYGAVFSKVKKLAPERLDLLAGLMWVHMHQLDSHAVWPAASVAQHTVLAKALRLDYDAHAASAPWLTMVVRKVLASSVPGSTPQKRPAPGPSVDGQIKIPGGAAGECRRCPSAGLSRSRCPRAGPAGPLRWGRCPAALAVPPPLPLHCWWSSTSTACPKRGSVSVRPRTPTVVAVHPPG